MSEFKHVCVVGCGLIGGSFALALRRAGFAGRITACGGSRSPRLAVERGIADAVEESFERGEVCEADLIYLAAPIGGIAPICCSMPRVSILAQSSASLPPSIRYT